MKRLFRILFPFRYSRPLALTMLGLISVTQASAGLDADRWRWSNPMPHGNNILDMLVTDEFAVQVGDAGSVQIRRADNHWLPATTGVTNYLRGTALFGSRILVTGENGMILWSDDGRVFQPADVQPPTTAWFEGVAAGGSLAVAVGDFGTVYTSTNGLTWGPVNVGTSEWLRGVAWGGNGFVAVGENGTMLRSQTGTSWTSVNIGTSEHLNRVRRLGKESSTQLVAVGNGGTAFRAPSWNAGWSLLATGSTNALYDVAENNLGMLLVGDEELRYQAAGSSSWTPQIVDADSNSPPAWVYLSAAGSGGWLIAAGRTGLIYEGTSTNGATLCDWQPHSDSSYAWLWDATVQNGVYTAVGDLATILTSLDGIVWAREVVPGSVTNTVLLGVGGDTNRMFAVGNAGAMYVSHAGLMDATVTNYVGTNMTITNIQVNTLGLIWTNVTGVSTQDIQGIAARGGHYVISGAQGSVLSSADGTNWMAHTTGSTSFLSGITAFDGGWLACGANGTLLRAGPDATTWTPIPLGTSDWVYRVRDVGGQLVAVGQNGRVFSSPDGTHWTTQLTGTQEWLNDVTFAGGTWYVVGTKGTLFASTNLTQWTRLRLPTMKSLFAAQAWGDQLVLAGIEGVVLRNRVAPVAAPVNLLDYSLTVATNNVASGTNVVSEVSAYELFLFGGQVDQQFRFQSCTNGCGGDWTNRIQLELYDASGSLYLIRTRPATNMPPSELYRTQLIP